MRVSVVLAVSSLLVLSSCILGPSAPETRMKEEIDRGSSKEQEEEPAAPVSVEEVEASLLQLTLRMELPKALESLGSGSEEIDETLALIFSLEKGPLPIEKAVRRAVYRESGEIYHSFTRTARKSSEGRALWKLRHEVEGKRHLLEVLVNKGGIPLEIDYREPATGRRIERETKYRRMLDQGEEGAHSGPSSRSLSENPAAGAQSAAEAPGYRQLELEELVRRYLPPYYQGLEIVGTEKIEEAGRTTEATHLRRELGSEFGGDIHVWYSREVPGRILRVRVGEEIRKVGIEEWDVSLESSRGGL